MFSLSLLSRTTRLCTAAVAVLFSIVGSCSTAVAQISNGTAPSENTDITGLNDPNKHWVGTWAVTPQPPFEGVPLPQFPPAVPPAFNNQTLRQIVHVSVGSNRVRVRISNTFGTDNLLIGAARVGLSGGDARILPGTNKVLTFSGRSSVTIPPGALVASDPVSLDVPAFGDLAISVYLPNATLGLTQHSSAYETNYLLANNQAASLNPAVASTNTSYYFLTNVEAYVPSAVGAVVCIGDSITDGTASTVNLNRRWTNILAERIQAQPGKKNDKSVLNEGLGSNRLLQSVVGPSMLARFDRDVVAQVGATDLIVLAGINDIGYQTFIPSQAVSADDIIAGYRQLIARAHDADLRIYGATLLPYAGSFISDASGEAKRLAVNNFIRNGGEFDGVIDFEATVGDFSTSPTRLLPQYDSGDHLHPNDAGHEAMASAINLRLFKHD